MTVLHHEIDVTATPAQVWEALTNLPSVQHYNPMVREARWAGDARTGVGAARVCDFKPKGRVREEVTHWEEGLALGIALVESDWPLVHCRWVTHLEPSARGTRIFQDIDYEVKFGVVGRLMDSLFMRRKFNGIMDELFASMKTWFDSGMPQRGGRT